MSQKLLRVHEEARAEIDSVFSWYFERSEKSAETFLTSLARNLIQIAFRPKSFEFQSKRTRRCVMRKFPYPVLFKEYSEFILVVAVAHAKRHPGHCKNRV